MQPFPVGRSGSIWKEVRYAGVCLENIPWKNREGGCHPGAPCGATWEAAEAVQGVPVEEAVKRIGLLVQCYCKANPAGWDPISGKSPIHIAGKHHAEALRRALKKD